MKSLSTNRDDDIIERIEASDVSLVGTSTGRANREMRGEEQNAQILRRDGAREFIDQRMARKGALERATANLVEKRCDLENVRIDGV